VGMLKGKLDYAIFGVFVRWFYLFSLIISEVSEFMSLFVRYSTILSEVSEFMSLFVRYIT
jgi:hypothetical protein